MLPEYYQLRGWTSDGQLTDEVRQKFALAGMNYLVIGAGPAGVVAAETLRKLDPSSSITILGDEPDPPYSRMAIPYLLIDNIDEQGTYLRKDDGYFRSKNIDVVVGRAASVDPAAKTVKTDGGDVLSYDKMLVATGSRPIKPPVDGIDHEKVTDLLDPGGCKAYYRRPPPRSPGGIDWCRLYWLHHFGIFSDGGCAAHCY